MSPVKRGANAGYHWLEQNPVTGILVSVGVSVAVTLLLVGALGIFSVTTFQGKTACAQDPAGEECAEQSLDVAKAEPLRNPCASFQRVTARRGRNCDQFYVPRGGRPDGRQDQGSNSGGVGTAPDPGGSGGGSGPVVDGGDAAPAPAPGKGDSEDPQAPGGAGGTDSPSPPNAPSVPDQSPVVDPPDPEPEAQPNRNVLSPTLEGVQKGTGEIVGGVGGTVDTVRCKLEGTC